MATVKKSPSTQNAPNLAVDLSIPVITLVFESATVVRLVDHARRHVKCGVLTLDAP